MPGSHGFKGRTTDEAFEEQCFLWERGTSVGVELRLLNFISYYYTEGKEKTRTRNRSLLTVVCAGS